MIWQANWIAVGLGMASLAMIPLAETIFRVAGQGGIASAGEVEYFRIICLCGPGLLIGEASKTFYSGRGQTWVVMVVDGALAGFELVLARGVADRLTGLQQ